MAVNLSMLAGAGAQFFTDSGVPLTGGLVYTYAAGTTTPQAAYTTSAGNVAHANPIVLDSAGRVPSGGEIWITQGQAYKFVVKTSTGVTLGTYNNIVGSTDPANIYSTFAASSGSSLVGYTQGGTSAVATTVQAKLRESVSVKDFGATGDGTTDDTTAIQAAIDSGSTVYFPDGTYLVSTAGSGAITRKTDPISHCLLLNNDNQKIDLAGAKIIIDMESATTTTAFGVVADYVYISRGNITNSNGNVYPTASTVSGIVVNGQYCTISDTILSYSSSEQIIFSDGGDYGTVNCCDSYDSRDNTLNFFGVRGCKAFDSIFSGGGDGNAIMYGTEEMCVFENCTFFGDPRNGATAIGASQMAVIESGRNCAIINCTFDGQGQTGFGRNGPIVNRSRECTIKGNIIRQVHNGIIVRDTDIAGAGGLSNVGHIICNNTISELYEKNIGQTVYGMWLESGANINVSDNTFLGTKLGVSLQGSSVGVYEISILNRTASSSTTYWMSNLSITNNQFIQVKTTDGGTGIDGFFSLPITVLYNQSANTLYNLNFSNNVITTRDSALPIINFQGYDVSRAIISNNAVGSNAQFTVNRPFIVSTADITYSTINGNVAQANAATGINWLSCENITGCVFNGNMVYDTSSSSSAWKFIVLSGTAVQCAITGNVCGADSLIESAGTPTTNVVANNTGRNNNAGTAWVIGITNGVNNNVVSNAVV
jgi:parallel beta-helix repeat protein